MNFTLVQNNDIENDGSEIYTLVEEMPEFPGGLKELLKFIASNLDFPPTQIQYLERIKVRFIIDEYGIVCEPTIQSGNDMAINNEVLRMINLMPLWKPGKNDGKPVKVYFTLPLRIGLE
ncbi:MAG: hypothetical protein R2728_06130 [Chitinophagales bacterium]